MDIGIKEPLIPQVSNSFFLTAGQSLDTSKPQLTEIEAIQEVLKDIEREDFLLGGHTGSVCACCINPISNLLFTGGKDKLIKSWSLTKQCEEYTLSGHFGPITCLETNPSGNLLGSSSEDMTIKVWDLSSRIEIFSLKGHEGKVWGICFSPDLISLISGSDDCCIKVWNLAMRNQEFTLVGHTGPVNAVKYLGDSLHAVSSSDDGWIKVWNLISKIAEITVNTEHPVKGMCLSPFNNFLATYSNTSIVQVWNLSDLSEEHKKDTSPLLPSAITYSPSGNYLAIGYTDSSLEICSTKNYLSGTFHGHTQQVNGLIFTTERKQLISISQDSFACVWNLESYRGKLVFKEHTCGLMSVCISPDCTKIISCDLELIPMIWSVSTGECIGTLKGHTSAAVMAKFSKDGKFIASCSYDKTIKIWSAETYELLNTLTGHSLSVYCIEFSHDSEFLASGSRDQTVKLWNFKEPALIFSLKAHDQSLYSVDFSRDGRYIGTGSIDKLVKIINIAEKKVEIVFEGHTNWVKCARFTSDSKTIVSISGDQTVKIWNLEEKREEASLTGHSGAINSLALSPDDKYAVTGSGDNYIKLWNLPERREEFTINAHTDCVNFLDFSPNGEFFVSAGKDKLAKVWEIKNKGEEVSFVAHDDRVRGLAYTPDGSFLISGSNDKTIKIWDLLEKSEPKVLKGHENIIWGISISPNGNTLASGSHDGVIKLWDLPSLSNISTHKYHLLSVNCVSFSPCGQYLASASNDKTVKLLNINDHKDVCSFNGHQHFVWTAIFVPSGVYLVSGSNDKTIRVWNVDLKTLAFTLTGHTNAVYCIAACSNGQRIVSGSVDTTVKVWCLTEFSEEFTLTGHSDAIRGITLTASGRFAVSGGFDKRVIVWNLHEKRKEYVLYGHTDNVLTITVSPDGNFIASGGADKQIKLWNLNMHRIMFVENHPDMMKSDTLPSIKDPLFKPAKIPDPHYQPLIPYTNAISCLKTKSYAQLSQESLGLLISSYSFSTLHFLSFLGLSKVIEAYIESENFIIKADAFGHSPLYYSIKRQHQKCTDLLLQFLINSGTDDLNSIEHLTSLHAIRHDLVILIRNSSSMIHELLSVLICQSSDSIYFGKPYTELPIISLTPMRTPILNNYFKESSIENQSADDLENQPLIMKTFKFILPATVGSLDSIEFLKIILECKNEEIYRTELIQFYIRYKWNFVKIWVYSYTFLVWVNLVLITLIIILDDVNFIYPLIGVNALLLVWEFVQFVQTGVDYVKDWWNVLDMLRLSLTGFWIFCLLWEQDWDIRYLLWWMILLNVIRGLTGFRAFDKTRYYIKLILISLSNIKFFMIIFIYTTMSFGLLSSKSSKESGGDFDYKYLWIYPFSLTAGDASQMFSDNFELKYLSFCLALIINIILMLNMLISILGDAFDEFQLKSEIFDYSEIAQVLLEIEQIKSLFSPVCVYKYLHICDDPYRTKGNGWTGKVLFTTSEIEKTRKIIEDKISRFESSLKTRTEIRTKVLEEKINGLRDNFKNVSFGGNDGRLAAVEARVAELDSKFTTKIQGVEEKLDLLISLIKRE